MNTVVVYSHPWKGSFNHSILGSVLSGLKKGGNKSEVIDLVKDRFNPVFSEKEMSVYEKGEVLDPKVRKYQQMIDKAEQLVFIIPVWWGAPPAVLKGFADKVFLPHWAYDSMPSGLLKGRLGHIKRAVIIMTMGAPVVIYNLFLGDPVGHVFGSLTLRTCGIKNIESIKIQAQNVSRETLKKKLVKIEQKMERPE